MSFYKPKFGFAAFTSVALVNFVLASGAFAQNLDLEKYCKALYGKRSRATLVFTIDSMDWLCLRGAKTAKIDLNDLCHQQYGKAYAPVIGNRADVKSWSCVQPKGL